LRREYYRPTQYNLTPFLTTQFLTLSLSKNRPLLKALFLMTHTRQRLNTTPKYLTSFSTWPW